ncbi:hypothetical protein HKCCSP123_02355 [Rhodobacterales bacterium HKCCSP123]|nr:hypothetical protein [Rhodobacterales bacterium HKCCSP123]
MAEDEDFPASGPERPKLTFPPEVAAVVSEAYGKATCILEYGSGGSTVLASEMPGKTVYSVESDRDWARRLERFLDMSPHTSSRPEILHVDVGPTGAWGRPLESREFRKFPSYAFGFWCRTDRDEPDTVLIDGRFRVACFLATALMLVRPATVLWDDYVDRPRYHWIERVAKPVDTVGRMARFHLGPDMVDRRLMLRVVEATLDPN